MPMLHGGDPTLAFSSHTFACSPRTPPGGSDVPLGSPSPPVHLQNPESPAQKPDVGFQGNAIPLPVPEGLRLGRGEKGGAEGLLVSFGPLLPTREMLGHPKFAGHVIRDHRISCQTYLGSEGHHLRR